MAETYARDGHRIHYRRHGSRGPAVVMVQGLGLAGDFWFDVPERLAEEHGQRVLVIDNRGVGRSDLPRRPFGMGQLADDVATMLDAEGVDRAVVVGLSMGGMVAQHVALRHPQRVEGLVLMATTGGGLALRPPPVQVVTQLLSVPFGRREDGGTNFGALARLILPRSHVSNALEFMSDWPQVFEDNPIRPEAFFGQLGAVLTHFGGPRLRAIRCPTMVVTGDDDVLIPPRNAELLARAIPGAELEVIHGVGHGIPLLDEESVARNVLRVRTMKQAN